MNQGGPSRLQITPHKVAVQNDLPAVQVAGACPLVQGAVAIATAS